MMASRSSLGSISPVSVPEWVSDGYGSSKLCTCACLHFCKRDWMCLIKVKIIFFVS